MALTDKEHAKELVRINRIACKWKSVLNLHSWDFLISVRRSSADMELAEDAAPVPKHSAAVGICKASWKYKHAHIEINGEETIGRPQRTVEDAMLHEMLHAVVHEMREWECGNSDLALAHEERVVSELTMVIGDLQRDLEAAKKPRRKRGRR